VSAKDDDEVLGVHVIGPMRAADQRTGARHGVSASTEISSAPFTAHPTLSEAIHEAALRWIEGIDGINR